MIIELFGLPGSGKTTLCEKINKSCDLMNPLPFYRNNLLGKIIFKLYFFSFNFFNKKNNVKSIKKELKLDKYYNSIDKKIKVDNYIKYMFFVKKMEDNKKKIILDEGIIHYCIALYAEFEIPFEIIEKLIQKVQINNNVKIYGLERSVEEAFSQIKKRNRRRTSIDFVKDNELKELLERYYKGVNYFKTKYCVMNRNLLETEIKKNTKESK